MPFIQASKVKGLSVIRCPHWHNLKQPATGVLEVRESNQAAIALYRKSGFHQIDLRKTIILNQMVVVGMPLLW